MMAVGQVEAVQGHGKDPVQQLPGARVVMVIA